MPFTDIQSFVTSPFEPIAEYYVGGVGDDYIVACVAPEGYPQPTLSWQRNGEEISKEGRIRFVSFGLSTEMIVVYRSDGRNLFIDKISFDDAGDYVCIAENIAGRKQKILQFHVSKAPVVRVILFQERATCN